MKNLLIILSFFSLALAGSGLFAQERVPLHTLMFKEGKYYFGDVLFTGTAFTLHSNGQLGYEANYKDGNLDGLKRFWHENGLLRAEGNYKDGKQDGISKGWSEAKARLIKNKDCSNFISMEDGTLISMTPGSGDDTNQGDIT